MKKVTNKEKVEETKNEKVGAERGDMRKKLRGKKVGISISVCVCGGGGGAGIYRLYHAQKEFGKITSLIS